MSKVINSPSWRFLGDFFIQFFWTGAAPNRSCHWSVSKNLFCTQIWWRIWIKPNSKQWWGLAPLPLPHNWTFWEGEGIIFTALVGRDLDSSVLGAAQTHWASSTVLKVWIWSRESWIHFQISKPGYSFLEQLLWSCCSSQCDSKTAADLTAACASVCKFTLKYNERKEAGERSKNSEEEKRPPIPTVFGAY